MNKSKRIRIWIFTVTGIVALTFTVWNMFRYPYQLQRFHDKELNGIVTYIYSSSGGTRISINNESEKHLIFTEYNDNIGSFFYNYVSIGDSIYKAPNDKYVHIFKQKKEFLFKTTIK